MTGDNHSQRWKAAECLGTCTGRVYDFWDTCVPPGPTPYRLLSGGRQLDLQNIEVTDSQTDGCAPEADGDSDTETEIEIDSEEEIPTDEPADSGEADSEEMRDNDSESGEIPSQETGSADNGAASAGENSGCTVLPATSSPGLFRLLMQLL